MFGHEYSPVERAFGKHGPSRVQRRSSAMQQERKRREARWQISPARRLTLEQDRRDENARCVECKTPAFRAFGDHVALRAWILEHRAPLAAELRDYFRKNPELHARPDHWFGLLTGQLRREVALAYEQSELAAASGLPLTRFAALEDAGTIVSPALRAFVVDGFVALVCVGCRSARHRTAQSPQALRQRYANWFFDGDVRTAQTSDPLRWQLLDDAAAYCFSGAAIASKGRE